MVRILLVDYTQEGNKEAKCSQVESLVDRSVTFDNGRNEPVIVGIDGTSGRQQNKIEVLRRYKFLLAFENNNR